MTKLLRPWLGRKIIVTLRTPTTARLRGVLVEGDGSFLVLEQEEKGRILVPVASVLYMWSADQGAPEELPEPDRLATRESVRDQNRRRPE
jgi:hypothetical protein